jgi:linoleoyl-CoA desaturase
VRVPDMAQDQRRECRAKSWFGVARRGCAWPAVRNEMPHTPFHRSSAARTTTLPASRSEARERHEPCLSPALHRSIGARTEQVVLSRCGDLAGKARVTSPTSKNHALVAQRASSLTMLETELRSFRRSELANRSRPPLSRLLADLLPRLSLLAVTGAMALFGDAAIAGAGSLASGVVSISLIGSWFHEAVHNNLRLASGTRRVARYAFSAPFAASQLWWDQKHLRGHHPYPKDALRDSDIQFGCLARVSADQQWRPTHRVQHWTFWLLAPLGTLAMTLPTELARLRRADTSRTVTGPRYLADKYGPFLIVWVPVLLVSSHPWLVFACFFGASGVTASLISQVQHNSNADVCARSVGKLSYQLLSSSDLSGRQRLWWWMSGGTSFHTVHHLVPQLTFLELPAATRRLSLILEPLGYQVHTYPTMRSAWCAHVARLAQLSGRPLEGRRPTGAANARTATLGMPFE